MTEVSELSLTDPLFFATGDPEALWSRWRKDDPVHLTQTRYGRSYWSLTRLADIMAAYRDPVRYSSQRSGPSLPSRPELFDKTKSDYARMHQSGAMLPSCDPPRHGLMRRAFQDQFTPKAVKETEPRVRALAGSILDEALQRQELDFATDIAARLPIAIIFAMMDIPREDWKMLFDCANMSTAPEDPEFSVGTPLETRIAGSTGIMNYCRDLAKKRRANPGPDVISMLATARVEDQQLTDDELGLNGYMFVVAGQETTRNSLSAGMLELIRRPKQMARLRTDRELLNTAPDEFVRWASPVAHVMRTATEDFELHGKQIAEGDWIVLWNASGNRDEEGFRDAHNFDVSRRPNQHVGFGSADHFCLGAHLARLEMRTMMELLLDRIDTIELNGDIERVASIQFCGLKRFPVRIKTKAAAA